MISPQKHTQALDTPGSRTARGVETLLGYNVAIGGGPGMAHNRANSYPRVASLVGFVGPDALLRVTRAGMALPT